MECGCGFAEGAEGWGCGSTFDGERVARTTEDRMRKRIRFLENKFEEEELIRDSILSSHEKDLSDRYNCFDECAPRAFSRNFNPRNNRRGFGEKR